jgi:hypothetical protein
MAAPQPADPWQKVLSRRREPDGVRTDQYSSRSVLSAENSAYVCLIHRCAAQPGPEPARKSQLPEAMLGWLLPTLEKGAEGVLDTDCYLRLSR